jgi:hypothetical protein
LSTPVVTEPEPVDVVLPVLVDGLPPLLEEVPLALLS